MRIGIQTWGSEGDIRPFLALAGGLSAAGHEVRVFITEVEGRDRRALAGRMGFELSHIATPILRNPSDLEAIGLACISERNPVKQASIIFEGLFEPVVGEMYSAAEALCSWSDLVIGHYVHYPVRIAAEKLKVPEISVALAHNVIPSRFIHPPGTPNLGRRANPFWWWLIRKILNHELLPAVNRLRSRQGLKPAGDLITEAWVSKRLNLVAVSSAFAERQEDWGNQHQVCGFMNLPEDAVEWRMPESLKEFMAAGSQPVYMTFGSLMPTGGEGRRETIELFKEAARLADCRAIIQVSGNEADILEPDGRFYYSPPLPHKHVFPDCAAVVHHGGAGTTQSATLSGVPSIVVAHIAEQAFWGSELKRLGIGADVLSRRSVTPASLARNLRIILDSPRFRGRAQQISKSVQMEDGVNTAVRLIETFFAGRPL